MEAGLHQVVFFRVCREEEWCRIDQIPSKRQRNSKRSTFLGSIRSNDGRTINSSSSEQRFQENSCESKYTTATLRKL